MPEAFTWRRDHYMTREGGSLFVPCLKKNIAKSASQGKVTLKEAVIRGSE
jgi:hypothetical protein